MKKFIAFLKESYDEMIYRVTWTKYEVLRKTAVLVLVASAIFALVIGLIDVVFKTILEQIYNIL